MSYWKALKKLLLVVLFGLLFTDFFILNVIILKNTI